MTLRPKIMGNLRLGMELLMDGLKNYLNNHTRPLSKLFTASTPRPLQSISRNVHVLVVLGFYGSLPSVAFLERLQNKHSPN